MSREALPEYPWDLMGPYRDRASAYPGGLIDLSIGSPVDETPRVVREALASAAEAHSYPTTTGTAELRLAIVDWYMRRRGVSLAAANVLPTIGSKELVALLPFLLGLGTGDVVVHPLAAYPSYEMGALLAGATPMASDDPAAWPEATRLVWLNSPGNPDGRVLGIAALKAAVARARELGAVIVGDECYAELGWEGEWVSAAVPSILDPRVIGDNRRDVLAIYSLSKQSNMAGYRIAFVAGCRDLIEQLTTVRKHAGLMLPQPLQTAMIAALKDEQHVIDQKARYSYRRTILKSALEKAGYRIDSSEAGLYLWATEGFDAWDSVAKLAEHGILVGPGHFYGIHYPEHIRLALTATDKDMAIAAERLASVNGV